MALTRNRLIGNLANATDSAASSSFLAKGATEADYQSIAYSDVTGKPAILDSAGITSIVDSAYVLSRQGSAIAGLDSAGITSLVDSNYVVARAAASGSGYSRYNYTATAGQTVFQDSDNSGAVLSYTSGGIMVFYNGVMLKNTADWEGTDGSSVTLVEAADSGANVSIHKWTVAGGAGSGGGGAGIYGDRAIISIYTALDYFDITTPGNASSFGSFGSTPNAWEYGALSDAVYGVMGNLELWTSTSRLEYITIATPGNGSDFGDLSTNRSGTAGLGDGTYGFFCGGKTDYYNASTGSVNTIDYITVASPSNATDFGDLVYNTFYRCGASDGTYGFVAGGFLSDTSNPTNKIDVFTTATPGNATTFGNLDDFISRPAACSNETRMLIAGGRDGSNNRKNVIQYITTATSSNASDFGDLSEVRGEAKATNNATRAVIAGGYGASSGLNSIDYVTMATPSNATDFGDLTTTMSSGMDTGISGHAS